MECKYVRLDEFCDSVRDGTHDTPKKTESGYKLITAKHINNEGIDFSEAYLISEEDYNHINERSKVEQWDVLMSMIGNGLGKSFIVSQEPDYAIKNLALFKIGNEYKAKWLHYFLSSSLGQGIINSKLQGTGQPFISLSFLRKMKIIIPSSENEMIKIASILSTYDTLIENNIQRIRLLEQMAENLYKEWFVRFRFPEHENVEMENGLPKGWKRDTLKTLGITLDTGKRPSGGIDSSAKDGVPSLGAEAIKELASFDYSSVRYIPNDFYKSMKRGHNTGNDILVYKDGAYIGKVTLFRDEFPFKSYAINEHVFFLSPTDKQYHDYLYFTLHQPEMFVMMQNLNRNAAQPGLSKKDMEGIKINIPSKDVVTLFNSKIEVILQEIFNLAKQNRNLTRQRDLLLPRLMSGKLEVVV